MGEDTGPAFSPSPILPPLEAEGGGPMLSFLPISSKERKTSLFLMELGSPLPFGAGDQPEKQPGLLTGEAIWEP